MPERHEKEAMSTAKKRQKTFAPITDSTSQTWRGHQHRSLGTQSTRTVIDDSGSLAITAWTCVICSKVIEEIQILSRDGTAQQHKIRYTVAPVQQRESSLWPEYVRPMR